MFIFGLLLLGVDGASAQVSVEPVIAIDDDVLLTDSVDALFWPTVDSQSRMAVLGATQSGEAFIYSDGGVALGAVGQYVDEIGAPTEERIGISDGGGIAWLPAPGGIVSVATTAGTLLTLGDAGPFGSTYTSLRSPSLAPAGGLYFVASVASGETFLLFSADETAGDLVALVGTGTAVDGGDTVSYVTKEYDRSDNGAHYVIEGGSTLATDDVIFADGIRVAIEGEPSGNGDNWGNFDIKSINDSGDYVFSGDTQGATDSDEYLAYNGVISVQEGDILAGVTLGANVRSADLNNLGVVLYSWTNGDGGESLFYACDASDIAGTTSLILSTGDVVDIDGDGVGDATVSDLNGTNTDARLFEVADAEEVYVSLDLGARP
jgi:hypothetical protein